jgi:hypothetical protein
VWGSLGVEGGGGSRGAGPLIVRGSHVGVSPMVRCVCGCACGVSGGAAWAGGDQMSDGFQVC